MRLRTTPRDALARLSSSTQRYSTTIFCPSTYPRSLSACRNASVRGSRNEQAYAGNLLRLWAAATDTPKTARARSGVQMIMNMVARVDSAHVRARRATKPFNDRSLPLCGEWSRSAAGGRAREPPDRSSVGVRRLDWNYLDQSVPPLGITPGDSFRRMAFEDVEARSRGRDGVQGEASRGEDRRPFVPSAHAAAGSHEHREVEERVRMFLIRRPDEPFDYEQGAPWSHRRPDVAEDQGSLLVGFVHEDGLEDIRVAPGGTESRGLRWVALLGNTLGALTRRRLLVAALASSGSDSGVRLCGALEHRR
jgi:hypothetical protein